MCHGDDGGNDSGTAFVALHVQDEAAVDLEFVDGQVHDVAER